MAETNEAAVRARLAAEADKVMHESRPTPTQAEVDAVRTGNHDDRPADDNPSMRPLHEQRAMIEEAKNADQKAATAEPEQALYRTRAMTPRLRTPVDHNDPAPALDPAADHSDPAPAPAAASPKKPA